MRYSFARARLLALVFVAAVGATVAAQGAAAAPSIPQYTSSTIPLSDSGYAMAALETADVNGDGIPDLLGASNAGNVQIRYGDGAGGFSSTFKLGNIFSPAAIAVADVNGDGRQDLVVVASGSFCLALQNADGIFGANFGSIHPLLTGCSSLPSGAQGTGIALGDVDGDGRLDAVVSTNRSGFLLYRGVAGGFVATGTVLAPSTFNNAYARLGDLNGDGHLDLVTNNAGGSIDGVDVRFGNGDGSFGDPVELAAGLVNQDIALGDVNGDGLADIVVAGSGVRVGHYLAVYLSHADGSFTLSRYGGVTTNTNGSHVTLGDLNGDGSLDIFSTEGYGTANVFVNDGNGGFVAGPTLSVGIFSTLATLPAASGRATLYTASAFESQLRVFTAVAGDTTPPVVIVPAPITAEATSHDGAVVTFDASSTDDTDGTDPVTCSPASGSTFPLGTTAVTCAATDAAGNRGTAGFSVRVRDTTGPVVNVPATIVAEAESRSGAHVSFAVTATDAVDGAVAVSCTSASGVLFPLGVTTVRCFARDATGNPGSGSFLVAVRDTTPPVLDVHDVTLEATSGAGATWTFAYPTAADAIDGPVSGTVACPGYFAGYSYGFPLGQTVVTCYAHDSAGNQGVGRFTVTVRDTTAPVLTLPASFSTDATSPAGAVVTFTATARDAVAGATPVTCAPASGSTFAAGDTTVSCTAADPSGNTASGAFTVHVRGAGEQIDALAAASQGVGPGKSLAAKVADVRSAYGAGDVAGVCSGLDGFESEVTAQSGKHVSAATADALLATARRIQAVVGC